MQNFRNLKIIIVLGMLVLLFFTIPGEFQIDNVNKNRLSNSDETSIFNDRISLNIIDYPILIDDSNPDYNWSKTASDYSWCKGSGTWLNPYIIEDIIMDGIIASKCLTVQNSNVYFKIQNCTIKNSDRNSYSIWLNNVVNGTVINNILINNDRAIVLSGCHNNTIIDNIFDLNKISINIGYSTNTTITNNTLNSDNYIGISLSQNINTILRNNKMVKSGISLMDTSYYYSSIRIDTSNTVNGKPVYYYFNERNLDTSNFTNAGQIILGKCSYSTISDLDISSTVTSLTLLECDNNIISNNNFYGNSKNGIFLFYGTNNTLIGNHLHDNSRSGIQTWYSKNNNIQTNNCSFNSFMGIEIIHDSDFTKVSNNYITNFHAHRWNYGINIYNCINNTISGNVVENVGSGYRLEYMENNRFEKNTANQCDYGLYLNSCNKTLFSDNFLLNSNIECIYSERSGQNTFQDMFCNTAIKVNVPSINSFFRQIAPDFNVEIDLIHNIDQMWYTLDSGFTNTSFTTNGTISQAEWDKLETGLVTLQFYANDTLNNIGSGEVIIRKDINQPVIEITLPNPNDEFESLAPEFNITITEEFLDTI